MNIINSKSRTTEYREVFTTGIAVPVGRFEATCPDIRGASMTISTSNRLGTAEVGENSLKRKFYDGKKGAAVWR